MNAIFSLFKSKPFQLALLALLACFLFYQGTRYYYQTLENVAKQARDARDAYWQAEIARANEEAAKALAKQREIAEFVEEKTQAEILNLNAQLNELENANAALPNSACGLDIDRVRLLNNQ